MLYLTNHNVEVGCEAKGVPILHNENISKHFWSHLRSNTPQVVLLAIHTIN